MNEKNGGPAFRLKEERERLGYSQPALAELGSTKLRTLQNWEGGKNYPSSEFLAETAKFGVDVGYVLTGSRTGQAAHGAMNAVEHLVSEAAPAPLKRGRSLSGAAPAPDSDEDVLYVPLLSATGSMGPGNELLTEDVVMGEVPFSRHWLSLHLPRCRPAAIRLIHAYGDSMHGTLESGDFALVDTDVIEVLIDGVYVLEAHSRLFIKRVRQRFDGRFEVSSDNQAIKTSDILDGTQQICIKGRVVYGWNGRRF